MMHSYIVQGFRGIDVAYLSRLLETSWFPGDEVWRFRRRFCFHRRYYVLSDEDVRSLWFSAHTSSRFQHDVIFCLRVELCDPPDPLSFANIEKMKYWKSTAKLKDSEGLEFEKSDKFFQTIFILKFINSLQKFSLNME